MGKGSKSGACKSASHQLFKDRAKNRVDDLQGMFSDLQSARKESRTIDVAVLEEQVQMLREWKSELNEPSPASSLQQGGSRGTFSSEIYRLLQLCEEEDDATSTLADPKPEPDAPKAVNGFTSQECKSTGVGVNNMGMNNMALPRQLDYHSFDFHQEFEQQYFSGFDSTTFVEDDGMPQISGYEQNVFPPPSAFLGPKCALWDCPRPALGSDWSQKSDDYCSIYHAGLAPSEGYPGTSPVVRPGGIGLKDNLLFAALSAKAQGKDVGIPECEGAATAKSPWNAPELFDLTVLDGETIRVCFLISPAEHLRVGIESKDLCQIIMEGVGTSQENKLEVKRVDGKKTPKGKLNNDSVADLQKQLGRLTAEFPNNKQRFVKARGKANMKDGTGSIYSGSNALASPGEGFDYIRGAPIILSAT
ncbi:UNVERIFIED_CONTAM: Transcription factor VOZ1 [Sesamum radiatum]|uniref:Transcription factor VOZ1 n=1 Tax=Sesamum radiatum TaxID=300843 RepID=A0AAW2LU09_SESRA